MIFSKKTTYRIFLLILLLNIILRYPIVPHEIGWDSFVVHSVSNSLSEFGFAKWWLHPTSVMGSYPYSIGSAVPFLLSGISQLSGLNIDLSILLYGVVIGLACVFIVYIMAGSLYEDSLFKFLVAFGFSTSSAVLTFSTWTVSTRTLFAVILLPLILYILLKSRYSSKYYILLAFILLLGLVTHHYIFFVLIFVFTDVLLKIVYNFKKYVYVSNININIFYIVVFVIMISYPFFTRSFMQSEGGYTGTRYGFVLMLIQSYFRYSGLLLLFAAVGFIYLVFKNQKNQKEWFLLISFALLSPLFYMETYIKWFLPVYFSFLSCISLANIFKKTKIVAIILILACVFLSGYFQFIHILNDSERYLEKTDYASGMWISDRIDGNLVGTSRYTTLRIFSISETPTLTISDLLNYMNGLISLDEGQVVQKYSKFSINYYKDSPYVLNDASSGEWYVNSLPNFNVNGKSFKGFKSKFNISYFILDIMDYNDFTRSLLSSDNFNHIYANGGISIWSQ